MARPSIYNPTTALKLDTIIYNTWQTSYMFQHISAILRQGFNKEKHVNPQLKYKCAIKCRIIKMVKKCKMYSTEYIL
jgi:hypothetical protein